VEQKKLTLSTYIAMAVETCVIGVKQKGNQENGHPRDTGNSGHKTQNEEKQ
jgi:hypothetical protein